MFRVRGLTVKSHSHQTRLIRRCFSVDKLNASKLFPCWDAARKHTDQRCQYKYSSYDGARLFHRSLKLNLLFSAISHWTRGLQLCDKCVPSVHPALLEDLPNRTGRGKSSSTTILPKKRTHQRGLV